MRMRPIHFLIAIAASSSGPAYAADRAPIADEHRLSDAEVHKVFDAVALKRDSQAAAGPQPEATRSPARPIDGEIGVAIGTGGYREAFGTAYVPLGNDGLAILSFDTTDFGSRYSRRRR